MKKLTINKLRQKQGSQEARFSSELLQWYDKTKRDLPWRATRDPYLIWLSEIILQQTRVAQGLPYYLSFAEQFPNVESLASAPLDDVLKLWQGLGYYSRAKNLHFTAKHVVDELDGQFPNSYDELIKLKGIGPYTAAAISSFSAKEVRPVVDGNVNRVLSRYYAISTPIDETQTQKQIMSYASQLIPHNDPDKFNQAIMELGAIICTPKKPSCHHCPIQGACRGLAMGIAEDIPIKSKKVKVQKLKLHYYLIKDVNGRLLVRQRDDSSIWKGLHDFPCEENPTFDKPSVQFLDKIEIEGALLIQSHGPIKHLLTHRKIYAWFHLFQFKGTHSANSLYKVIPPEELTNLALPRLIDRYWQQEGESIMNDDQ